MRQTAGVHLGGGAGRSDSDVYDVAIVGAGLIGLATAYQLQKRCPELRLVVVDKEPRIASHQSGHNSGVLHAGVYYAPGSLKARLCVTGKAAIERFAEEKAIPFERCGKLIVATDAGELPRLAALRERAVRNGVAGVTEVDADGITAIEPHVVGVRAVHVPGTAIIDFTRVAEALAEDVAETGGTMVLGAEVEDLGEDAGSGVTLVTSNGDLRAGRVIVCAGLHSDRLGRRNGQRMQIVPFRGDYYTLKADARSLVRGLVYPVPDPTLPFLGVHFTRRIDGAVWAGPNAVLALAREGYGRTTVDIADLVGTLRFPGFWRLSRRYWRVGAIEAWRDLVKPAFVQALRRYVPDLASSDLVFGPSGVRAQAVGIDGAMIDDFAIDETEKVIYVRNAPSPGATASLAIGDHLAQLAIDRFSLGARRDTAEG
ncbi:MAG: L-2-hydroxyglutarate oxidase [Actinomycetota bacterium]|nr:L-2-hydroxyglutarate oxidase [Actinomycetota bacterium]